MKSVIASIGLFAALTNAYQPRHFHWRRDNSTTTGGAGALTTLTVQVTEVKTITSCAPTITNCPAASGTLPASDLYTFLVTNTVILTETICPVSEADSISISIIKEHETGGLAGSTQTLGPIFTTLPSVPLSTGVPATATSTADAASGTEAPDHEEGEDEDEYDEDEDEDEHEDEDCPAEETITKTTVTHVVQTKTLTMTLGKGDLTSVVTTTIFSTHKSTILVTETLVHTTAAAHPIGGSEEEDFEATTTTTVTSIGTKTLTVKLPGHTETATVSPGGGSGSEGSGSDSEHEAGDCPAPVTVTLPASTILLPASTVYITLGDKPEATAAAKPTKTKPAFVQAPEVTHPADEEEACPPEESVVTMQTTVTVQPYPAGNGTSSGAAQPTASGHVKKRFTDAQKKKLMPKKLKF